MKGRYALFSTVLAYGSLYCDLVDICVKLVVRLLCGPRGNEGSALLFLSSASCRAPMGRGFAVWAVFCLVGIYIFCTC